MKTLNETTLKENWDKLISIVNDTFSGLRKDNLLKMYHYFEERMMFAPASGTAHFHNCFVGGYVAHVLHITEIAQKLFRGYQVRRDNSQRQQAATRLQQSVRRHQAEQNLQRHQRSAQMAQKLFN